MGSECKSDDVDDWDCFQMNCEGHLISIISSWESVFQLSNESIEHLSNFPHLRNIDFYIENKIAEEEDVTNLSLLSDLRRFYISNRKFVDPDFLKDLGLFSNLLSLEIKNYYDGFLRYFF